MRSVILAAVLAVGCGSEFESKEALRVDGGAGAGSTGGSSGASGSAGSASDGGIKLPDLTTPCEQPADCFRADVPSTTQWSCVFGYCTVSCDEPGDDVCVYIGGKCPEQPLPNANFCYLPDGGA